MCKPVCCVYRRFKHIQCRCKQSQQHPGEALHWRTSVEQPYGHHWTHFIKLYIVDINVRSGSVVARAILHYLLHWSSPTFIVSQCGTAQKTEDKKQCCASVQVHIPSLPLPVSSWMFFCMWDSLLRRTERKGGTLPAKHLIIWAGKQFSICSAREGFPSNCKNARSSWKRASSGWPAQKTPGWATATGKGNTV